MRSILLLIFCWAHVQGQEVPVDIAAKVDAYMKAVASKGAFQGVALIKVKDDILLRKGYGSANVEWGIASIPETKYRIGSITKQFAAAAILQLEEKGLLSVSDSITEYYPEAPESWASITIEHLLRHTAGLSNYFGPPLNPRDRFTPEQLIALVHERPLAFPPGARYLSSNTDYLILGLIIERVSGLPFEVDPEGWTVFGRRLDGVAG
jgi:CubicO group peptidase (beta-lactamase class C family)